MRKAPLHTDAWIGGLPPITLLHRHRPAQMVVMVLPLDEGGVSDGHEQIEPPSPGCLVPPG